MSIRPKIFCNPAKKHRVAQVILSFSEAMEILRSRLRATPEEVCIWLTVGASSGKPLRIYSRVNRKDCPDRSCQVSPMLNSEDSDPYRCFSKVYRKDIKGIYWAELENYLFRRDDVEAFTPAVENLESLGGVKRFTERGERAAGQIKRLNPSGRYISWSDAVNFLLKYTSSREGAESVINNEYKAGTLATFKSSFAPKNRILNGSARRSKRQECPDYAYFYEGQILGLAARASNSKISRWDAISHPDEAIPGQQNDLEPASPERYKVAWHAEIVKCCPDIKEVFPNCTARDLFNWLTKKDPLGRAAPLKKLALPRRFQCEQPEPQEKLFFINWDDETESVEFHTFENFISTLRNRGLLPRKLKQHPVRR